MLPAFTLTLFLSALLLMLVQPMVGKLLLPWLGGTPSVWNTCMVFFQAVLLGGYSYAHLLARRWPLAVQQRVHLAVLLLPLAPLLLWRFDPGWLADRWAPPTASNPAGWLLLVLALLAGLPFFAVSATAPLLQRWFADTSHRAARDPYFLYAASNVGSLLALLSYPLLVERWLGVQAQATLWAGAYGLLVAAILICGRLARAAPAPVAAADVSAAAPAPPPSLAARVRWVALAAVPSSVMLGTTTALTTDIAPVPLLWVLPLALYLLSFVLVFSFCGGAVGSIHLLQLLMLLAAPFAVAAVWLTSDLRYLAGLGEAHLIGIHLLALFVVAMACHGELARTRPPAVHLTSFYLLLSLGGVLGGMFNALLAPVVFDRVIEYPLALAAAFLLLPGFTALAAPDWLRALDRALAISLLLFGLFISLAFLGRAFLDSDRAAKAAEQYPAWLKPKAAWLAGRVSAEQGHVLLRGRNFFGTYHLSHFDLNQARYHYLMHGSTMHGMQRITPAEQRGEPLAYFHRRGPVGQFFDALRRENRPQRVAIAGVGAGCLATYIEPDWSLTLYDIDQAMVRIAQNPENFTYLTDCAQRGTPIQVELGDARLRFAAAPDEAFDLIVLDAFSSDAIPIHLLTHEAFQIYLRKLAPGGRLLVHISNRYLDLAPVLGNLADAENLQAVMADGASDRHSLEYGCTWVVLARDARALERLHHQVTRDGQQFWRPLPRNARVPVWTDDVSNLWAVFRW